VLDYRALLRFPFRFADLCIFASVNSGLLVNIAHIPKELGAELPGREPLLTLRISAKKPTIDGIH
jgi:hypothetical protein